MQKIPSITIFFRRKTKKPEYQLELGLLLTFLAFLMFVFSNFDSMQGKMVESYE